MKLAEKDIAKLLSVATHRNQIKAFLERFEAYETKLKNYNPLKDWKKKNIKPPTITKLKEVSKVKPGTVWGVDKKKYFREYMQNIRSGGDEFFPIYKYLKKFTKKQLRGLIKIINKDYLQIKK